MKKFWFSLTSAFLLLLMSNGTAWSYAVGGAVALEKLASSADLIFKGTAISSEIVGDAAFRDVPGYACYETEFKVASVVKGDPSPGSLKFRHYDRHPDATPVMYSPQSYHFEPGRSYVVLAKKNARGGLQQIWMNHTGMVDEGVWQCADDRAVEGREIKKIIWSELTGMLKSTDAADLLYAIRHLDGFSGGGGNREINFDSLMEFSRNDVLSVVHGLMTHPQASVAREAIEVVGSHNPYLSVESAPFWLAAVGKAPPPGIGAWNAKMKNVGGARYRRELVALADSKADNPTRALAVAALGLVRDPALGESIIRWLTDPAGEVRAAATLLLADFPTLAAGKVVGRLSRDTDRAVRSATAHMIGFGQYENLTPALSLLLHDEDEKVRRAAEMSLLTLSPREPMVGAVLVDNLKNEEFAPLFLLALAREDAGKYRDGLAEAVERQTTPKNWSGGQIPAFTAWQLLYDYLQSRPQSEVASGTLDRYLDALEQVGDYSSQEPCNIYAFYLQHGLAERAQRYRQNAGKKAGYDLDQYFKKVEKTPEAYLRRP